MYMAIPNHNVGQVFLDGEGEEGQELKGSVTVGSSVPKGLGELPLAH